MKVAQFSLSELDESWKDMKQRVTEKVGVLVIFKAASVYPSVVELLNVSTV